MHLLLLRPQTNWRVFGAYLGLGAVPGQGAVDADQVLESPRGPGPQLAPELGQFPAVRRRLLLQLPEEYPIPARAMRRPQAAPRQSGQKAAAGLANPSADPNPTAGAPATTSLSKAALMPVVEEVPTA